LTTIGAQSLYSCGFSVPARVEPAWLSGALSGVCCPFAARTCR
jgi:hypothetical protein